MRFACSISFRGFLLICIPHIQFREASEAACVLCLVAECFVLNPPVYSVRGDGRAGRYAMLDWIRRRLAVAALHDARIHSAVLHSGHYHYALLRHHRQNDLGQRHLQSPDRQEGPAGQRRCEWRGRRRPDQPPGELSGHHSTCQGEDGEDDVRHRDCFHRLLVAVHRLRPAAGLWSDTKDADKHRGGDVHSELSAAEFRCKSADLLPLLGASYARAEVRDYSWNMRCSIKKGFFREIQRGRGWKCRRTGKLN